MKMNKRHLWQDLYAAAANFRDQKMWRWMDDTMIFGVEDPRTAETNYCVVLGYGGEVFAFQVYKGGEGLWSFLNLKENPNQRSSFFVLNLVEVSFEDRETLFPEDLSQIKELGLNFRGKKQWPMFRSYQPGYFPWFIEEDEARVLLDCLEQAMIVGPMFKEGLAPEGDYEYPLLVRALNSKEEWVTRWEEGPEVVRDEPAPLVFNELDLHRVSKVKQGNAVWEADVRMIARPIQEKKGARPYYPYCCLIRDTESGMLLNFEMLEIRDPVKGFGQFILDSMMNIKIRPKAIEVCSVEARQALQNAAEPLDFRLVPRTRLPEMDIAFEGLLKSI